MVFSNAVFLFIFLPVVIFVYYLLRGKVRNYWLLLVSLIFYAWSKPSFLWILLGSIAINYIGGLCISVFKRKGAKCASMVITVAINLLLLFYFKYFNFTVEILNRFFKANLTFAEVLLPIGISFFTFQGLSYVVDVYWGNVSAQRNIFKLGMYISLFPQLVAGPIVRYKDVAAEIDNRSVTLADFTEGVQRFILGLFKKIIIADTLALTADAIFTNAPAHSVGVAWLGAIAYSFQLLFDFAGYSDMAIGLGRIFGFHFMENFNYPYISKSITEFWRRWHISLSTFFRDYVYIPLGGNRRHVLLNVAIVFLLTGIWHGAAFSFIAWGMWHGFFSIMERVIRKKNAGKPAVERTVPVRVMHSTLQHVYTLLVVLIGWVFFRAPGLRAGMAYVLSMVGMHNPEQVVYKIGFYLNGWTCFALVLAVLMSTPLPKMLIQKIHGAMNDTVYSVLKNAVLLAMLFLCVLQVASGSYSSFIYFRF